MGLIDSHAHLTSKEFADQIGDVLDRATQAGVDRIISIGVGMADSERVLALAATDARVIPVIGIHPHEAGNVGEHDWDNYRGHMNREDVVALGEMGLDYHYDFSDRSSQHAVFEKQLELASQTNKPIVIHCREAHEDTLAILTHGGFVGRPVVFHCFTGSESQAKDLANRGWRISFTGVVTFKKSIELQRIAKAYPMDQLMVETDSPYLSPMPIRHIRPNEPAHVAHTARFIADLKGLDYDEFVDVTANNTKSFFQLV